MAKALKEKNWWPLSLAVVVNIVGLYIATRSEAVDINGVRGLFGEWHDVLPAGVALIMTTVLNGLLPAAVKERLVFWRWRHPLPGSRAFTEHAREDSRIDLSQLEREFGPLPTAPAEQNKLWYKLYRTVENEPAVWQVHKDFLLMRDYAGISFLFLLIGSAVGSWTIPSLKVAAIYAAILILQYLLVRQAASTYGVRLVTTAMAARGSVPRIKSGKDFKTPSSRK